MTYLVLQALPGNMYKEISTHDGMQEAEQAAIRCALQTHKTAYVADAIHEYAVEETAETPARVVHNCV